MNKKVKNLQIDLSTLTNISSEMMRLTKDF